MSFGGGSGSSSISGSTDVVLSSPTNSQVLGYNTSLAKWQNQTVSGGASFVSVLSYGAVGNSNGTAGNGTDDTAAINAAITANPGKVIQFPAGHTYRIITGQSGDADHSGGIKLNQPGTTLFCYGATFVMDISPYQHYQMVDVTAADCAVLGGRFIGDLVAHTGSAGEWGYGISIGAGAHRFTAENVYAKYCWGDGFFIWEYPSDVSLVNCIADNNRRQGLSIIDALRPRVAGGAYINTGMTKYTGPGAGIDIEPDAGSGRNVRDALISGVTASGNGGAGIMTAGQTGAVITATITACLTAGNGIGHGLPGLWVVGVGNTTELISCVASNNEAGGIIVAADAVGTHVTACHARGNGGADWVNNSTSTVAFPVPGVAKQTGVPVTAAGVHAALVNLGLITG